MVEFLLVAPFLVIFLGILTEYAYALNVNMTLSQGLKTATASIYHEIKPNMSADTIKTLVASDLKTYLKENNAPITSDNKLNVVSVAHGNTTVFMATYTYIPAFTLPNVYFHFMPDEFKFIATSAVPSAFLQPNNYGAAINSSKLDSIWAGTASFSSLNAFSDSENGVMNSTLSDPVQILFLVPVTTPLSDTYALVFWNGTPYTAGTTTSGGTTYTVYYIFRSSSSYLYKCTSLGCAVTSTKMSSYLSNNNYKNVIFVHDDDIPPSTSLAPLAIFTLDSRLSGNWVIPSGTGEKISSSSVDGVLKRTLALIKIGTDGNQSVGNYDNLPVSAYNNAISPSGNAYKVTAIGSSSPIVVVYNESNDEISRLED